ncbi:hypothetical protein M4D54_07170 [Brachybacterium sp. p3-SID1565]|uniref:SPW repeat-containing protein n=1 Tax=Brachybacterium epidermidis TaxID=2781983 RepID=A0ABR9W5K4_9MICO|nr:MULTISPECIES: hypothetical protein [Brachybacterium]MBE9404700.1 hypothetical protein [Brachybacterium epidermidis]MCT1385407.1 hypothetical protein [Brachybacterium sp. p3-SID1565]MCT1776670.1 hypothetical protein [Brachybacterium sp. p3-SID957]
MYRTRIWPLPILIATPLLVWAFHDRAGWGHSFGVVVIGLLLTILAVSCSALPYSTFRTAVTGIVVLCVVAPFASGIVYGDPLVAVPFLAALGGAAALVRAPQAPRPPQAGAPAPR